MELTLLAAVIVAVFIVFVNFWNHKWKSQMLDEREIFIRLKVRELISRSVEIALVVSIAFHLLVRPLSGLQAFIIIGVPGIFAEAFGNWWLRKESREASD